METSPAQSTANTAEPSCVQEDSAKPSTRRQREEEALQALRAWVNSPQSGQGQRSVAEVRIRDARASGSHTLQLDSLDLESLPPHLNLVLPNVKTLDLSKNHLTALPDTLPLLEELDISDNPLETLPSEWPRSLKTLHFSPEQEPALRAHAQQLLNKDIFRNIALSGGELPYSQQDIHTNAHQLESFLSRGNAAITHQPTSSAQEDIDARQQEMRRLLALLQNMRRTHQTPPHQTPPEEPAPEFNPSCCMKFLTCVLLCCTSCCLPCVGIALLTKRGGYSSL